MKPLAGVRVVDMTVFLAGSAAGVVLGDWGADVIKLEPLAGEPQRHHMFFGHAHLPYNYYWECLNRNKRGVAVDLKHPRGREIAYRLIEKVDVFVSNIRGKSLARLGMDYESLSRINPRLIYAHATGYGPQGPDSDMPSFDDLAAWMRAGTMAVHSLPDQPPVILVTPIGDTPTGFFLAAGAVLGLMQRQQTGKGLEVNASLLATGMWENLSAIQEYLACGSLRKEWHRESAPNPIFNTYPTKDGWLQLDLFREGEWEELCRALGREELMADPRFATREKRSENNQLLIPLLEEIFRSRTNGEWKALLNQYDLTWGAVQDVDQVVVDPQVLANKYLIDVDNPNIGKIKVIASPVQFNRTPFPVRQPAPELGQHTGEVLLEIGYTRQQIEELEQAGVIACSKRPERGG